MASSIDASTSGAGGVITTADNTGILNLKTAGTNAVTIDTSQNVGIGTTSPATKLDITNGYTTDNNTSFTLTNSQGSSGDNGAITYRTFTGSGYMTSAQINSGPGSAFNASYLKFRVADSSQALQERMRIDSSGSVLVGTTSSPAGATPTLIGGVFNPNTTYGISLKPSANVTTIMHAFFNSSGTLVGSIQSTASATSYVTSSDYRLKENIVPMTGALDKVAQLKPVTYTWKIDGSEGQGFIAHELAEVVPDAVVGEKDAVDAKGNPKYQGIDTSFLVATLTAAIQEQQTIINDLKARVTALEAK